MPFDFHPAAASELLDAVAFYESRKPGLGRDLVEELDATIAVIVETPLLRPVEFEPDIRCGPLRRFPFSIIYRCTSGPVQVLAVAHHRRRHNYWADRR